MTDRYTWVSMRFALSDQVQDAHTALSAIRSSTGPARAVLLLRDCVTTRKLTDLTSPGLTVHLLAEFPSGSTTPLITLDNSARLTQGSTLRLSPWPFLLILIDNHTAPGFDLPHLNESLPAGSRAILHPPPNRTPPWRWEDNSLSTGPRHHPLLSASQTWYRSDIAYNPPSDTKEDGPNDGSALPNHPVASLNPVLALLGLTPKGLQGHVAAWSEDWSTSSKKVKDISKIILNYSLLSFRKDEAFRKWRRKCVPN